jgi:hypothetical protein
LLFIQILLRRRYLSRRATVGLRQIRKGALHDRQVMQRVLPAKQANVAKLGKKRAARGASCQGGIPTCAALPTATLGWPQSVWGS